MSASDGQVPASVNAAVRLPAQELSAAVRECLHPLMLDFLDGIFMRGRDRTAVHLGEAFCQYQRWLQHEGLDPVRVTRQHLEAYQNFVVMTYRTSAGQPLARGTAAGRISAIKRWYGWLTDRDHLVADPARTLGIRVVASRVVRTEHLNLQETTALVQTQAERVTGHAQGTWARASELRNLAMICLALATGRRVSGIQGANVAQVDLDRRELRVEVEKGHVGRVLPVAGWAIDTVRWYLDEARPLLTRSHTVPWLFVDRTGCAPIQGEHMRMVLERLVAATIVANPDLTDLPGKHVTWHSLRVSFATLLFGNGCDIRSVNELMLHRKLSTTAKYTPVPVDDLRQVFRTAHPRA